VHINSILSVVPSQAQGISDWLAEGLLKATDQTEKHTGLTSLRSSPNSTLDLAMAALLEGPNNDEDIPDAVIFVTQTPAHRVPGNAALLAGAMGWNHNIQCWDLSHGCAGLVWGLYHAHLLLKEPSCRRVLLVAAETHSRLTDLADRSTRTLFGDGATLWWIRQDLDSTKAQGAFGLGTLPDLSRSLATDNTGCLRMDGLAVFEFAVREVVPRLKAFMHEQNQTMSTWLFHQAGGTVLQYMQRALGLDPLRVPSALDGYGNTGSASLGILLSHCFPGESHPELERAMLVGFGSGFQWGFHLADLSQTRIHPVHELHPDGRLVPLAGKGI
jgi:3-oxoacyl-[acyl-carrier-protein] synthase-3